MYVRMQQHQESRCFRTKQCEADRCISTPPGGSRQYPSIKKWNQTSAGKQTFDMITQEKLNQIGGITETTATDSSFALIHWAEQPIRATDDAEGPAARDIPQEPAPETLTWRQDNSHHTQCQRIK